MKVLLLCFVFAWAPACSSDSNCADCGTGGSNTGGSAGVSGSGNADAGADASISPAQAYCNCMLTSCHDEYHLTFGPESDEVLARENCLSQAGALPTAGKPVAQGNFVECRLHFCQLGAANVTACPDSVGEGACQ